jgi:hypothetical protein
MRIGTDVEGGVLTQTPSLGTTVVLVFSQRGERDVG